MPNNDDQLVYLTGSGHSGSTLLDMLLSRHPQIAALGEAHRLYLNANRTSKAHRCTCGETVQNCDFWRGVESVLLDISAGKINLKNLITTEPQYLDIPDDSSGENLYEPIPKRLWKLNLTQLLCILGSKTIFKLGAHVNSEVRLHKRIGDNSHLLYRCVREFADRNIVIDSTKTPARLKVLFMTSPVPFKVIYLIRDGRAVTASRIRRQGIKMSDAARIWKSEHIKIATVLATLPRKSVYKLSYEQLCVNPMETLKNLSQFIGVRFDKNMMTLDKYESHALGGNTMRWRKDEDALVLDERWRNELSEDDLRVYYRLVGPLHKKLGY